MRERPFEQADDDRRPCPGRVVGAVLNERIVGNRRSGQRAAWDPFLIDSQGRTLYLWQADTGAKSTCTGACASAWPPLVTTGKPTAGSGVTSSLLGTTKRATGNDQVTYNGDPLYLFAGDTASRQTNGQGSRGFGAPWYVLSPYRQPAHRCDGIDRRQLSHRVFDDGSIGLGMRRSVGATPCRTATRAGAPRQAARPRTAGRTLAPTDVRGTEDVSDQRQIRGPLAQ